MEVDAFIPFLLLTVHVICSFKYPPVWLLNYDGPCITSRYELKSNCLHRKFTLPEYFITTGYETSTGPNKQNHNHNRKKNMKTKIHSL